MGNICCFIEMASLSCLILVCIVQLFSFTSGFSAYDGMACPVAESKANLNIRNFMGLWYILEYQYPTEMAVADLSCLSFRFREAEEGIIGNFTFKFPPGNGQFYHLPTFSNIVATGQDGLWMTEFKGATLLSLFSARRRALEISSSQQGCSLEGLSSLQR